MRIIKQNTANRALVFLMVDSTDHITGKTGLTPTVTLSKNGGAFASPSGAVSEIGNGLYKVAANATDSSVLGSLVLHATATGADPCDIEFEVVAFDPQDSVRIGLTALPNVVAGGLNGLPLSVDTSGRVEVLKINGFTQTGRDLGNSVLLSSGTGTGQVKLSLGYVGIDWGDIANKTTTNAFTNTSIASVSGAVGSVTGAVGSVTGNVGGSVASVTGDVSGKVLGGGAGTIVGDGVRAASVTGNVGGNVGGSVASVTGNVGGNVVGSVASVTGNVGGNVVGSVASVTGNVSGNVVGSVASVTNAVTVGTINANAINAAAIATDAIDSDAISASAVAEIQSGLSTLNATQVENAVWDASMASHTGATTYGGRVIRAANSNVTTFITGSQHIAADIHDLQPAVINNTHFDVGAIDSNALATSAATEIADSILGRNIAGGSDGGRMVKDALRFLRNKFAVVGTTLTVYQEDDTTAAWTSIVTATTGADPITASDPAGP